MTSATKINLTKPILITLYGFPGSGKSFVARHLVEDFQLAHLNSERLRSDLFENPQYSEREDFIVSQLMSYLAQQFLIAGLGVVYDTNARNRQFRKQLADLAKRNHADYLLLWLQIDQESAYERTQKRDRRTADDKYAPELSQSSFLEQLSQMQNPDKEPYLVLSGKHGFASQKNSILNYFYKTKLVPREIVQSAITKPGLVNLIPHRAAEPLDLTRRNISVG